MTGKTSAGEMVLLNPDGGGIALMSTTRVVYSAPNYFLNRNIYDYAFDRILKEMLCASVILSVLQS